MGDQVCGVRANAEYKVTDSKRGNAHYGTLVISLRRTARGGSHGLLRRLLQRQLAISLDGRGVSVPYGSVVE